jgi:purine-nucleoside phosphorylase
MKPRLEEILQAIKKYNDGDFAMHEFGLDKNTHYHALVVAPGWRPTRIIQNENVEVLTLNSHSYFSGYEVRKDDLRIAWIQIGAGSCNLIDELCLCAELDFDKLIFCGAVGSLSPDFKVGDICTPEYSISGTFANAYLTESLLDYQMFQKVYPKMSFVDEVIAHASEIGIKIKKGSVFCTDSIACEYAHLNFIKSFQTDLIEMETSAFYLFADLLEKPAVALLVVSDNSCTGDCLIGRTPEMDELYSNSRSQLIPKLIYEIAGRMKR